MTIDEAIAKYKEITNTDANCPAHCNISCDKCVQESKQLAEWLEELKELRKIKEDYSKGMQTSYATFMYNKAIDDFVNACKEDILCQTFGLHANGIERIAEQLKAGVRNGTDSQQ